MTEEQVQALFKSEVARLPQEGRNDKYHSSIFIPAYDIEGTKFEVRFLFDNATSTLSVVTLRPTEESSLLYPQSLCKRIEALLTEKYGSPATRTRPEDKRDTPEMASFEAVWKFTSTIIRLGYLEQLRPEMARFNLFSLTYEKPSKDMRLDRI